ncbi:MAG: lipid A biosynthesis lauroyl acyltransferase [Rhizobiaceae bacterium]
MSRLIRNPTVERALLLTKTASDWIVAKLLGLFLHVAKKLPAEKSTDFAEKFARSLALVLPRSKMARKNIALAFPEKTPQEVDDIVRGVWGNVGRTIAEYVFLDQLIDIRPDDQDAARIELVGLENFHKLRDSKKPVVIFTGHTGNWEILPVAAATYGLHITALFRPPNNQFLAKKVLKARRTDGGHLVPSRAGAAWALASVLDKDGAVGLLADQAFTKGPLVQFMGREATANPLASKLARQFDCDIHPARCIRLPKGRFRIELGGPIDIARKEDGNIDMQATTQAINTIIEGWVREYPEQWLWLHDRWKIKQIPGRTRKPL